MSSDRKGIDAIISEAIERGEFDDLPGKGKPIDLTAYFDTPEDLRVAYAMLKGADIRPHEIELLQEIAVLKEKVLNCKDQTEQADLNKRIQHLQLQFNTMLDRIRKQRKGG